MKRLTNKIIENLPTQSKGYICWDIETKGFGIRININGKKTFILKYRIGQERRASNSNILSVDQAIELKDKK